MPTSSRDAIVSASETHGAPTMTSHRLTSALVATAISLGCAHAAPASPPAKVSKASKASTAPFTVKIIGFND